MLHFAHEPKTLNMKKHVQYLLCNLMLAGLSLTVFAQAPANTSQLCSLTVNRCFGTPGARWQYNYKRSKWNRALLLSVVFGPNLC